MSAFGAERPAKRAGGLLVLAGCTIGISVGVSTVIAGSFTVFLKPIADDTGWSRSQVALGLSMVIGCLTLMLPWLGRIADRVGPRRVVIVGAPIAALSIAALGWIPTYYPLFLVCCALIGATGAATHNVIYYALLPRWFDGRLGLAVGVAASGAGIGLFAAPLLAETFISSFGWKGAYVGLGLLIGGVAMPVALFLLRDAPSQDGRRGGGVSAKEAMRSGRFWLIVGIYFFTSIAINGCVVHLVPLLTDKGIGMSEAAAVYSYLGIAVLVSRLVCGFLLDYLDAGLLGAGCFMAAAFGIYLLTLAPSETMAMMAILLLGAAIGAEGDVMSYIVRRLYGVEAYGSVISLVMAFFMAGILGGPLVAGAVFDITGSYDLILYPFATCVVIGGLLHATLTLRRPLLREA